MAVFLSLFSDSFDLFCRFKRLFIRCAEQPRNKARYSFCCCGKSGCQCIKRRHDSVYYRRKRNLKIAFYLLYTVAELLVCTDSVRHYRLYATKRRIKPCHKKRRFKCGFDTFTKSAYCLAESTGRSFCFAERFFSRSTYFFDRLFKVINRFFCSFEMACKRGSQFFHRSNDRVIYRRAYRFQRVFHL